MAVIGLIYVILIFIISFSLVHVIKLAVAGFLSIRKKSEPKPAPEKKNEPVYYIVEKKKQRRATYSEPREIKFK